MLGHASSLLNCNVCSLEVYWNEIHCQSVILCSEYPVNFGTEHLFLLRFLVVHGNGSFAFGSPILFSYIALHYTPTEFNYSACWSKSSTRSWSSGYSQNSIKKPASLVPSQGLLVADGTNLKPASTVDQARDWVTLPSSLGWDPAARSCGGRMHDLEARRPC
jgi:hypothetical protein